MEMDDIILKKCTEADVDILRSLLAKTFSDTFASMNTPENMELYLNQAFARDRILEELRNQGSSFYLLYQDGAPAGCLKVNEAAAQTEAGDPHSLEIERIYVAKEFQGTGLGSRLMDEAVRLAEERKKEYIWLGVWEKNERALRFYEEKGFYRTGSHTFTVGNDEQTDYIMRKDLSEEKR
jgi:ribosomal protein S18 acetylase RimI-like enzyme